MVQRARGLTDEELFGQTAQPYLRTFRTLEGSGDDAVSPAGAVGRYQVEPDTARQYGFDPSRLKDPAYNEMVASAIIADHANRYNGDLPAMAVAYNAGPGRADKWLASGRDNSVLPEETQKYLHHLDNIAIAPRPGGLSDADLMKLPPPKSPGGGLSDEELAALPVAAPPPPPSATQAFEHHAVGAIAPTAGGLLTGALAGAGLGGALGSVAGPIGTGVGGIAGMIGGGMLGGAGVQKGQDWLLNKFPAAQKFLGQDQATRQAEEGAHPYASLLGDFIPQAAAFKVGGIGALGRLANAGLMGATQAGEDYGQSGEVDPMKVGIAAGMGALQGEARGPVAKLLNPIHQAFHGVGTPNAPVGHDTELYDATQNLQPQGAAPEVAPQPAPVTPPPEAVEPELPGLQSGPITPPAAVAPPVEAAAPAVEPPAAPVENNITAIQRKIGGDQQATPPADEPVIPGLEAPPDPKTVIADRLAKIAASSPAGKNFADDVGPRILSGEINPIQAYHAIHFIGGALERVLGGSKADVAVRAVQSLLKDGNQVQGAYSPEQNLMQFSLHPDALAYSNETGAHETWHFLQQTFAKADPKAIKALGTVFNENTTLNNLPDTYKKPLQNTLYPVAPGGQPVTYWDMLVAGQGGVKNGGADKTFGPQVPDDATPEVKAQAAQVARAEAEAHIFGAMESMRAHGEKFALPAPAQRFSKFVGDFKTRLKNGLNGAGLQTAEDVMNAYAGGKAAETIGGEPRAPGPLAAPAAAQQEDNAPDAQAQQQGAPDAQYSARAVANEDERAPLYPPGAPERTGNLQRWFEGASPLVRNPDGSPRVLYHSTTRDFDQFNTDMREMGSHFGTEQQANERNASAPPDYYFNDEDPGYVGPHTLPVHLAIRNPVRVQDKGYFHPVDLAHDLQERGVLSRDDLNKVKNAIERRPEDENEDYFGRMAVPRERRAMRTLKEILRDKGHDGFVYLNRAEGAPRDFVNDDSLSDHEMLQKYPSLQDSYVAFHPNQVKSIFNRGTFDPSDPRLHYSSRKTLSKEGEGDFYSPTLHALRSMPGGEGLSMTGSKWMSVLSSRLGRYKGADWKGEHEWLGLNDLFKDKANTEITGKEIADRIKERSPELINEVRQDSEDMYDPDGFAEYGDMVLGRGENYRERVTRLRGVEGIGNHMTPDNLMHARAEDIGNGRLVGEAQSDPHQDAAALRSNEVARHYDELLTEAARSKIAQEQNPIAAANASDAKLAKFKKLIEKDPDAAQQLRSAAASKVPMDFGYGEGKVPDVPFKKKHALLNLRQELSAAAADGKKSLYLPTSFKQIAKIEGWSKTYEKDGQYFVGRPQDHGTNAVKNVTTIVKRMLRDNPRELNQWLKENGYEEGKVEKVTAPGKQIGVFDANNDVVETFPKSPTGYRQADDWINGQEDWDQYQVMDAGEGPAETHELFSVPVDKRMADPQSLWSNRKTDFDGETRLRPEIAYSRREAAEKIAGIPGMAKRMDEVYGPISPKLSLLDRTKNFGISLTKPETWKRFYMGAVDEAYPLAKLDRDWMEKNKGKLKSGVDVFDRSTGKDLAFQISSYKARAMVNRSAAHAGTDMFTAPFALTKDGDFTTSKLDKKGNLIKPVVPDGKYKGREIGGLMQIWAPAYKAGVGDALHFYMDIKRGMRLLGEGREKVFKAGDQAYADQLEKTFDGSNGQPNFKEMADLTHEFNRMKLDGMVKAGVITRPAADYYLRTGDYTPFYHDFEKEGIAGPVYVDGVNTGESVLHRKLKGSDAPLADPLQRWYRHMQALNHAMLSNESAARAIDQALDLGIARKAVAGDENTITVRRNGEKIKYVVDDPLLHESLSATDGKPTSPFMKIFSIPTNILRQFTTHVPTFAIMHATRESFTGFSTGDGKMLIPVIDAIRGMKNSLMNSASAQAVQNHGITGNFDYRPNAGQGIGDKLRERAAEQLGLKVTHTNGLAELAHGAWTKYERWLKAADAGVRTRVYEIEMAKHGNPAEAAYQAGAKAINFQRRGSSPFMSYAFSAIPFLNARIQGTDLILRTMVNQGKNNGLGGVLFSRSMALAGMTAAYYLAVRNNDTYKKAASIYKDGYWIVPMDMFGGKKGEAFIQPIPFEAGVLFKNIPEHIMRAYFGDDKSEDLQRSLVEAMADTLQFNPMPQLMRPAFEAAANYSFYTGRAIVPEGMQMPGAHKYEVEPSTSQMARLIGGATNQSPIKIDYLIRGYLGTVGEWGLEASDVAGRVVGDTPPLPDQMFDNPTLANTPFVKRFVRDSRRLGDEEVSRLYDLHGEAQGLVRTINRMEGAGDAQGLQKLVAENKGLMGVKDAVNGVFQQISQMNKLEMQIQAMPADKMNAKQKADMLTQIEDRKYAMAQSVEKLRDIRQKIDAQ